MHTRFRVSGRLADKLEELGVRTAAVLEHARLPAALFDQPKVLLTTEEFFSLWRGIGEVSQDPALGLKLGTEANIERYDPIAIAALCTPTFGEALQRMSKYKQLTCPEEIIASRKEEECEVQFRWLLANEGEPDLLIDLCFAWVICIARRGTGTQLNPVRVELTRQVRHRKLLEEHFHCAVRFESPRNALVLRSPDLDKPFVTRNADLLAIIAPQLDEELNQRAAQQSITDEVRTVIKRRLAGQRPTLQNIAKELRLSSRTLQRRLQETGHTFQQVLEQARRELARHYLTQSPLDVTETAYLLGYEDANSFVRAFHAWEGSPPALWRETHRGKAEPAVSHG